MPRDFTERPTVNGAGLALLSEAGGSSLITDPEWFDDFLAGGTGTGDIGAMGWEFLTGTATQVAGEAGRPGIFRRTSGATAGQTISTHLRGVVAFLPSEMFDMTFAWRTITSNYAQANMTLRLGLLDTTNTAPANGIFLHYVGGDNGNFSGACRSGGVQSNSATLGTIVADAWIKCRIRRVDAVTIGFQVNDGTEVTMTSNIPTAGLFPNFQLVNGNANARSYELDYWRLKIGGLSR